MITIMVWDAKHFTGERAPGPLSLNISKIIDILKCRQPKLYFWKI